VPHSGTQLQSLIVSTSPQIKSAVNIHSLPTRVLTYTGINPGLASPPAAVSASLVASWVLA